MNYIDLNLDNRKWADSAFFLENEFDWEEDDLLDYLMGKLPSLTYTSKEKDEAVQLKVSKLCNALSEKCDTYNIYKSHNSIFLGEIKEIIDEIHNVSPYWSALNYDYVEKIFNMQKSCLLFGEGGIGKSYFIKCLEEKLELQGIKHLCLYGKHCKNIDIVNFEEIAKIGESEEFVFIFDAVMSTYD